MSNRCHLLLAVSAFAFACSALSRATAVEPYEIHPARIIHCEDVDDHRPTVVTGVAITRDARTIAAATDDHRVLVWDANTAELKAHLDGHNDWVHSVVISADGTTAASGAADHTLTTWNIAEHKQLMQFPSCDYKVSAVSMHPTNQQIAVVGFSNKLQLVDSSTGKFTEALDCPCLDIHTIAYSPKGDRMAVAGRNGQIRVWDVANGKALQDIETDHRRIRAMAFSQDGKWLAAAGTGQKIRIIDTVNGKLVKSLDVRPAKVYALLFLDGSRLATGGTDDRITIWDLDSQRPASQLIGHTGTVAALACDATGTVLVSGSYDTTIRIWNLVNKPIPATASRGAAGAR
jgi:WD40 repeat protein